MAAPTFIEALRFWLTLGFISFGGPAGQIATMQSELVDRRRWIDQHAFLQALNFCMLLPGPEAQQLATYIGWKLHGLKGALAAGILFVLPGALILYLLAWIAATHGDTALVGAVFEGLKPVVIALVIHALWRIGRRTLTSAWALGLAVAAFAAIEFASIPFPFVVMAAGLVGWLNAKRKPDMAIQASAEPAGGNVSLRLLRLTAMYLMLLAAPLAVVVGLVGEEPFVALGRFFTQAAFVTFGGAYAVLPYVADAAVNHFNWLSPDDMINGLALAESTPGPLILVLQYVGFFAGWNAPGTLSPLMAASIASAVTTYTTFLPSIMLILAGAPYIERIARVKAAAAALAAITAAIVGVIATLALFFTREVIFTDDSVDLGAAGVAVAVFAVMHRFKVGIHWIVLAGAVFGLLRAQL